MTAATEIGTVAAGALDVALGPITLVVVALAAAVSAAVAEFKLFSYIADKVKPIGDAVKFVEDKVRDLISIMTLGFIDSSAVHQHKEDIKAIGDEHEKNSESLKKQISLFEAQGASSERIAERKKEQLEEEKKSLEAQMELETDIEKKKELQNKLDENAIGLIKNKKDGEDAHLETMRQQGATEAQILKYQQDKTTEEIKLNNVAIQSLQNQIKFFEMTHQGTDAMKKDLADLQSIGASLAGKQMEQSKQIEDKRKEQQKEHEASLQKMTELQISLSKKNSNEQIALKEKQIRKEADEEIKSFIGTQKEKQQYEALVNKKRNEDIRLLHQNQEEANQKLLDDAAKEKQKKDEETAKEEKAKADEVIKNKLETTKAAIDQITAKEKEAAHTEEKNIQEQLTNTKLSFAQKGELIHQLHSIIDTELQQEKGGIIEKYNLDIKAAGDNAEAKKKIEDKYADDIKVIDKKIADNRKQENKEDTANTDAANKDKIDKAKQVGKALIDMAKQVSDAIFENQKQKRDNELKSQLDNLNEQKDAELLNTTLTASQKNAIEKKYRIEEAQAKEKAWKADQKAKAEQAIINGLLAFTAALISSPPPANYINAAIALASAGVQAGIILSKTPPKFAKGVVALDGPGTDTSDSIAAYLSKGESVITARATKQYAPLLEAMNAGTFSEYMPIPQMPDVSHQLAAVMSSSSAMGTEKIDYEKLGAAFARKVNLKQLNINIDEKGFSKSILSKGSRIEYYNDKLKF
jgi:hypothetical protein